MKIYFLFSIFVVALASFLFGFNTAIISGALLYITDEFHLTLLEQGILVSSIILGAIMGSFTQFGDKFNVIANVLDVESKKAVTTENSDGIGIESIPKQIDEITQELAKSLV